MRVPRKSLLRRLFLLCLVLIILLTGVDYALFPYGAWDSGRSLDRGENGLWLRYTWYFGQHSTTDTQDMSRRLMRQGFRYAYFHVRNIKADGTLVYHQPDAARRLVAQTHVLAPGVKVIAWVYAGNPPAGGRVDLPNPAVRRAMVGEAVWLTRTCGFDGVQWDYEICPDGDAGFLDLLRETRAELGPDKTLSVATAVWLPSPLKHWGWSDAYIAQVAAACDQIAVMGYDTAANLPRIYVWLMHQQVVHFTQDAARSNPNCRVLIGVPTYSDRTWSHDPHVERLSPALLAIREGLADPRTQSKAFAGVAVFADYTKQPEEWRDYYSLWHRPPASP